MKRITTYLLLLLFGLLVLLPFLKSNFSDSYHYVEFKDVAALQEYLRYARGKMPLASAHRGGPVPGFPENSLEGFQNVLRFAPCIIECDVRKSKDGILLLMHDETLDRTTTGSGKVSDFTLADLKNLRLKDPQGEITDYQIPTLNEVLRWAVGHAILELDVKKGVEAGEIINAIEIADALPHVAVITYNLEQVGVYRDLHPELTIAASAASEEGVERLLMTGVDPHRLIVFVGVSEPTPGTYEILHQNGIRAILGTMHNLDGAARKRGLQVYEQLLRNGADILATDEVEMVSRAIRNFSEKRMVTP